MTSALAPGFQFVRAGEPPLRSNDARRSRELEAILVYEPPRKSVVPSSVSAQTLLSGLGVHAEAAAPALVLSCARLARATPEMFRNWPPAYTDVPETRSERRAPSGFGAQVASAVPVAVLTR